MSLCDFINGWYQTVKFFTEKVVIFNLVLLWRNEERKHHHTHVPPWRKSEEKNYGRYVRINLSLPKGSLILFSGRNIQAVLYMLFLFKHLFVL